MEADTGENFADLTDNKRLRLDLGLDFLPLGCYPGVQLDLFVADVRGL